MQTPYRGFFQSLLPAALLVLLAGCAAPADRQLAQPGPGSAERAARMLAGSYAGRPSSDGQAEDSVELVRLHAQVQRIAAGGVETSMSQRRGDGPERNFILVFRPTSVATRLDGTFSPLDDQDRPAGSCPMEVTLRSDGFVARTNPATCRFGAGGDEVALIKEIAHDGQTLVIGDRVVDPESGEKRMPDRVLQLQRVRSYSGWAGVRDPGSVDPASDWRMADALAIQSDGLGLDPEDAAGMPLGVTLDLAPYQVRNGEPPVLRLRVFDTTSGALLGQSWADPLATRIGLALPTVQVGLRLAD